MNSTIKENITSIDGLNFTTTTTTPGNTTEAYYSETYYALSEFTSTWLNYYGVAFFSSLGAVFSIINVTIFSRPTFKGILYQHLLILSCLDLLTCILLCMNMIGNHKISVVSNGYPFRFYFLYFGRYLAETLNCTALLTSIAISWDRYVLVSQKCKCLMAHIKPLYSLAGFFTISAIMYMFLPLGRYLRCWPANCYPDSTYPTVLFTIQNNAFAETTGYRVWYWIAIVMRSFIFLGTFVVVNVLLLFATREFLRKKKRLVLVKNSTVPTTTNDSKVKKPKKELYKVSSSDQVEFKILLMVLLMSGINAILRMFDILAIAFNYGLKWNTGLPYMLYGFAYVSYPINMCSNIFIYYFFNNHFARAFIDLFRCKLF